MIEELEEMLCTITGFHSCSLQPNSGANGEYAGLLAIKQFHEGNGDTHRNICLIPDSAHGTNPASASLAGMKIVSVKQDKDGFLNIDDLKLKIEKHRDNLAATMITYPSTYGVFENDIKTIIGLIHEAGGRVYLDGANMNAMLGETGPGYFGADVCHLNLHKTFAIPHGGGGPGVGPICCTEELSPFLPNHPLFNIKDNKGLPVSASPFGSASILPISYGYIALMGAKGLKESGNISILNANYMMAKLEKDYKIRFRNENHRCAHEFIIDLTHFKKEVGISEEDIAKRLMDFGFHAPTLSFPLAGGIMIEPTESEDKTELDRFCDAMLTIRAEIQEIEDGVADKENNVLRNSPHSMEEVTGNTWKHPYTRQKAAYPRKWINVRGKFWPTIGRIDNVYGDSNFVCTCPPIEAYEDDE